MDEGVDVAVIAVNDEVVGDAGKAGHGNDQSEGRYRKIAAEKVPRDSTDQSAQEPATGLGPRGERVALVSIHAVLCGSCRGERSAQPLPRNGTRL